MRLFGIGLVGWALLALAYYAGSKGWIGKAVSTVRGGVASVTA